MKELSKIKSGGIEYRTSELGELENGFVRISVKSVGLCRTDLLVANGTIEVERDIILGHEFSGDVIESKTSVFSVGQRVAVNPLYANKKFMGLDFDGCLRDFIDVPAQQVVDAKGLDYKTAAYVEPVAASMAVLKVCKDKIAKGAVYGNNRIAELTYIVLTQEGFNVEWLDEKKTYESESYDYIVETLFDEESLKKIINMLKVGGELIVKSRKKQMVGICPSELVAKELTFKAVNYYDFGLAIDWLLKNKDKISHLLGESYFITNWEKAFERASSGESKKIFINF